MYELKYGICVVDVYNMLKQKRCVFIIRKVCLCVLCSKERDVCVCKMKDVCCVFVTKQDQ
jgi:hypothetical protein